MDKQHVYLGVIDWVTDSSRGLIAQLRPYYEFLTETNTWEVIDQQDVKNLFPNRGYVTWFKPTTTVEGTPWLFQIEMQKTFDKENPKHDLYMAAGKVVPAHEVIDLREFGDTEAIRRLLTEDGLLLPYIPSNSIYLWSEDDCWLGPVHLVTRTAEQDSTESSLQYWFLEESDCNNPIRVYFPSKERTQLFLGGRRIFLHPGVMPAMQVGEVDWSRDDVLLTRVFKMVRQHDKTFADQLGLTNKVVSRAADLLTEVGSNHALELYRIKRAIKICSSLQERQDLIDKLSKELLAIPVVADKISEVSRKAEEDARTKIERELAHEIERTNQLRNEVVAAENKLKDIEAQIAQKREELEALVSNFEQALSERLVGIMARPEQELANIAVFRAALQIEGTKAQKTAHVEAFVPHMPWANSDIPQETELEQFKKNLRKEVRNRGFSTEAATVLHASFLSGMVPVLTGSYSFDLLQAYANHLAGGRLLWVTVPPTVVEPSDLLGRFDHVSSRFVPHANCLLDVLLAAQKSTDLCLIALDGFNHSAVDAYLYPILSCYEDAWKETRKRVIPLFHPSLGSSELLPASFPWPRSALLALILDRGLAGLPINHAFWTRATFINVDQFVHRYDLPSNGSADMFNVPLAAWEDWKSKIELNTGKLDFLLEAFEDADLRFPPKAVHAWRYFYSALLQWTDENKAISHTIVSCIAPLIKQEEHDKFIRALGSYYDSDPSLEKILREVWEILA